MGLSAGAVRYQARKRGAPTSERQWDGYLKWGLIPAAGPDGWPPETVERVIAIAAFEKGMALPRRLLRLTDARYPRPPELTRRAMLDIIPKLKLPAAKMRRIRRAWQIWSRRSAPSLIHVLSEPFPVLPPRYEWGAALLAVPDEKLALMVRSAQHFGDALVAAVQQTDDNIDDIDPEERMILVTVVDALVYVGNERAEARATSVDF